jgi:hypothetical protein
LKCDTVQSIELIIIIIIAIAININIIDMITIITLAGLA